MGELNWWEGDRDWRPEKGTVEEGAVMGEAGAWVGFRRDPSAGGGTVIGAPSTYRGGGGMKAAEFILRPGQGIGFRTLSSWN